MFPSTLGGEPSSRRRGGSADGRAESRSLGEGLRAGLVGIPAPHIHMLPWSWGSWAVFVYLVSLDGKSNLKPRMDRKTNGNVSAAGDEE